MMIYSNYPAIFANGNDYLTIDGRKKCLLFNCEVEYFARVLTKIENEFGRKNITVKYYNNPENLSCPGYAFISINNKFCFYIRTDMNYVMNSFKSTRIRTIGRFIDEQSHGNNNLIRHYINVDELIKDLRKANKQKN